MFQSFTPEQAVLRVLQCSMLNLMKTCASSPFPLESVISADHLCHRWSESTDQPPIPISDQPRVNRLISATERRWNASDLIAARNLIKQFVLEPFSRSIPCSIFSRISDRQRICVAAAARLNAASSPAHWHMRSTWRWLSLYSGSGWEGLKRNDCWQWWEFLIRANVDTAEKRISPSIIDGDRENPCCFYANRQRCWMQHLWWFAPCNTDQ